MPTIKSTYSGQLRCELTHEQSNTKIESDAPTDNNGKGERFSPTDLLSASLGACMMTIMAIRAEKSDLELGTVSCETDKIMESNPRRVGALDLILELDNNLKEEQRVLLEKAAMACPVAQSLHPDIKVKVLFRYSDGREMEYNKLG
ncbi:MAG TPA: OsmC family protein [Bacteroidia bacterium]|nr:OsmC family protein [Bacteroidia bacterium]HNT81146.1 OsmC family protein [Bacteroidia bacterium]